MAMGEDGLTASPLPSRSRVVTSADACLQASSCDLELPSHPPPRSGWHQGLRQSWTQGGLLPRQVPQQPLVLRLLRR